MTAIGINTHTDFAYEGSPYLDLDKTIRCIQYTGVNHLRDAAAKFDTCDKWIKVRNATGAKFCAFLPSESPANIERAFTYLPKLYRNGLIEFFEGPNEPDKPYCIEQGNSITWAADFQKHSVAPFANSLAKPLINMSVGSGWTADDDWKGNYDAIPNMLGYASFGNAHTYPNVGQDVVTMMQKLNELASLSLPGEPVFTTELGWDLGQGHTQDQVAADIIKAVNSNLAPIIYIYALFDDQSGRFGLFDNDGTPRAGAKAVQGLIKKNGTGH